MNWSEIQAIRIYRTKSEEENKYAATGEYVCDFLDFEEGKILTVMFLNDCVDGGWEEINIEDAEIWDSILIMQIKHNKGKYKIKHAEILKNNEWEDISEENLFAMANKFHKEFYKGE